MIVKGDGQRLHDLLARQGFQVEAPCGGKGICGKCRVKVRGGVSAPTENERDLLTGEELAQGWRLACLCHVDGEAEVELIRGENARILTAGGGDLTVEGVRGAQAAVDIGTTTIAAYLMRDGRTIDCEAAMNRSAPSART